MAIYKYKITYRCRITRFNSVLEDDRRRIEDRRILPKLAPRRFQGSRNDRATAELRPRHRRTQDDALRHDRALCFRSFRRIRTRRTAQAQSESRDIQRYSATFGAGRLWKLKLTSSCGVMRKSSRANRDRKNPDIRFFSVPSAPFVR